MKKIISILFVAALLLTTGVTQSQVTIGKNQLPNPSAVLDLQSNGKRGLLLPRVALTDTVLAAPFEAHVEGMFVYNTNTSADGKVIEGVYFNDGNRWWPTGADNKVVLFPHVTLSSMDDVTTIPDPPKGLLVFNTGEGGLTYTGYVFWNGNEWVSLTSGSLASGTIGSISCNSISLTPPTYTAGKRYEGTMTVPYTGSNGGVYPAMTIGPVNGLTATLAAGNFTPGAGTLAFAISGTPTVTTPEITTFPLNIGGHTCATVVGAGDGIAPGDLVFFQTIPISGEIGSGGDNGNTPDNWLSHYVSDLPIVGGKLRLDAYFGKSVGKPKTVSYNPRLVNITKRNVKFWFSAMTTIDHYNAANIVLAPNSWVNLDNGLYSSWGQNSVTSSPTSTNIDAQPPYGDGVGTTQMGNGNGEVMTLDLSLDNKWYRIYYYMVVDNQDITPVGDPANNVRKLYLSIQRLY